MNELVVTDAPDSYSKAGERTEHLAVWHPSQPNNLKVMKEMKTKILVAGCLAAIFLATVPVRAEQQVLTNLIGTVSVASNVAVNLTPAPAAYSKIIWAAIRITNTAINIHDWPKTNVANAPVAGGVTIQKTDSNWPNETGAANTSGWFILNRGDFLDVGRVYGSTTNAGAVGVDYWLKLAK